MKKLGVISYNIYANFTNYGSALQSWAMHQAIRKYSNGEVEPILMDYCPDILADKDPLNPMKNMWDTDEESRRMCELSMPAIRENYKKFDRFYHECFNRSLGKYTSKNFNDCVEKENLNGFLCGSDTIFCVDEFGIDDGYYSNYDCMKNGYSVSYAASFGDSHFNEETYKLLDDRLHNFDAIGIRESGMVEYIKSKVDVPVKKVVDPTLLLTSDEYESITAPRIIKEKYLLLYVRRHNQKMTDYAEKIANEHGWKVVEISLRATNAEKHQMFYEAGVEEFLSLTKYAECVITNSFHGAIMSVQFRRPFFIFSREQCDTKVYELLKMFGILDRLLVTGEEKVDYNINYDMVHENIRKEREDSVKFLKAELEGCK